MKNPIIYTSSVIIFVFFLLFLLTFLNSVAMILIILTSLFVTNGYMALKYNDDLYFTLVFISYLFLIGYILVIADLWKSYLGLIYTYYFSFPFFT